MGLRALVPARQINDPAQRAAGAVIDQDAVVTGHYRVPVCALGKGGGGGARGQSDTVGQGKARWGLVTPEAGDKQGDDH